MKVAACRVSFSEIVSEEAMFFESVFFEKGLPLAAEQKKRSPNHRVMDGPEIFFA